MVEDIKTYSFDEDGLNELRESANGTNWPVVYLIHNDECLYIGETTSAAYRMSQHLKSAEKNELKVIEIVFDPTFNKSVILDYEQKLIKYCSVDGQFKKILNKNRGQQASHEYYNRKEYRSHFPGLWSELKTKGIVKNPIEVIENNNIFKFSPYNSLTAEQNEVAVKVMQDIMASFTLFEGSDVHSVSLVNGCAGTGKTVLAISIINSLVNAINIDDSDFETDGYETADEDKLTVLKMVKDYISKERKGKPFEIGFVFPMPGIRETVRNVFKSCGNGLTASMVIGPNDVVKKQYDILFVDESHRLSKRKNLTGYGPFDKTCRKLGLDPETTNQLDWILRSARHTVLFYDENQSVKSSDVSYNEYQKSLNYANPILNHRLTTQMRCEGGDSYIKYIKKIMEGNATEFQQVENYEFLIFDDVNDLVENIRKKDARIGLCKTVAGFAWEWKTKPKKALKNNMDYYNQLIAKGDFDIEISKDGKSYHYIWNLSNEDWISREDSRYTIGCIHTSQGYDLNYVGVIFGEEIDYNPSTGMMEIDLDHYKDKKVKAGTDEAVLKRLIINTYTTILARGIKGCYVYACNPNLQEYLRKFIVHANDVTIS